MAKSEQYIVRRVADGTNRMVNAHSARGAMKLFVQLYRPPKGERFEVKVRGGGDWELYKVQ